MEEARFTRDPGSSAPMPVAAGGVRSTPSYDPRRAIRDLAEGKIKAFIGTIDPRTGDYLDDVYAQNKSLSEHVAADYHGRFLIELVQNGADAHPRECRDGEIEVCLAADEGLFGALYVANRGAPFTADNVVALARIGMSSKPPGESIGNKGLGFRSISHVCDAPQVFSQSPSPSSGDAFEGHRFTFALADDLEPLFSDSRALELARRDLPIFFLPIWIEEQPDRVRDYAARGFATVIRLPLRDADAAKAARQEIEGLGDQTAPLLLFMERLSRLRAVVREADGAETQAADLTRSTSPAPDADDHGLVDLGAAGRYLLIRGPVPEADIQAAIAAGVSSKQLHGSWREWKGDGEVALAVRLDEGTVAPRFYTYLPLGEEATAPFFGYLHGSFFPSSNRKAVDAGVALNALLLEAAANLAGRTIGWLTRRRDDLGPAPFLMAAEVARAAVDLTAWTHPASLTDPDQKDQGQARKARLDLPVRVVASLQSVLGGDLADVAVAPCLGFSGADPMSAPIVWRAPKVARVWAPGLEIFTPQILARYGTSAGIAPLWAGLGDKRIQRLVAFLNIHARGQFVEKPTPTERALIATAVAGGLPRGRRFAADRWTGFYRELVGFMEGSTAALAGRAIILCEDGTLRAGRPILQADGEATGARRRRRRGEPIEASLFFPPGARGGSEVDPNDERLEVPRPLQDYFAFATSALGWTGVLRPAREFLEKGLVSAYEGDTVLTRVSQVVNAEATQDEAIAGLRWAFAIWRRAAEAGRPITLQRQHRLRVPTADQGMVSATEAVFSQSWPDETLGKRLHRFLSAAPPDVGDLKAFARLSLAATNHRAFGGRRIAEWTKFLGELGVRRGLAAVALPDPGYRSAYQVTSFGFCPGLGLSPSGAAVWAKDIREHVDRGLSLAYATQYGFADPLWALPGQGDHERFSNGCRELYAELVVDWLATAPVSMLQVDLTHQHFGAAEFRRWSTPAGAFVRSGAWMPCEQPSADGPRRTHLAPCEVWTAAATGERFPHYLRQPTLALSKAIERLPKAAERLTKQGLNTLHQPTTLLAQAAFLIEQHRLGVSRHYEPQFSNLHLATWRAIADRHARDPLAFRGQTPPAELYVRRGAEAMLAAPADPAGPRIYVRDNEDEIAASLVQAAGHVVFDIKSPVRDRIGRVMKSLYGARLHLLSKIAYDVMIDAARLEDLPESPGAVEVCPWLIPMLATAIEALKGADATTLPADRSGFLVRLRATRLHLAQTLDFGLDGVRLSPPADRRGFMFRRADGSALVVALQAQEPSWAMIEACLPALCEAIELPTVVNSMRLAARDLAARDFDVGDSAYTPGDVGALARTLWLDDQAATAAFDLMGERLDARRPWIHALVHLASGDEGLAAFLQDEAGDPSDMAKLRNALAAPLATLGRGADQVIEACRHAFTIQAFRQQLELDFAGFNASLIAVGEAPETHADLHSARLLNYLAEHEVLIIEALRNGAAALLDLGHPAPDYATHRDRIRAVAPDSAWLVQYEIPPDDVLDQHLARWLAAVGAPALGANPARLAILQDVRAGNVALVGRVALAAAPLVRTWCAARGRSALEPWADARAEGRLRASLDAAGVIDFRLLDEAGLLAWFVRLGLWPADMDATLDRQKLGIDKTDIETAKDEARRAAVEQAAVARSVKVNNRDIDPLDADWTAISADLAQALPKRLLTTSLGVMAKIHALEPKLARPSGPGGGGDYGGQIPRVPDAKRDMIGRLGEVVVYHWLKTKFSEQDIDKAWVSGNGALQTGKGGSDSHGFDFTLEYRKQVWQIEVKASLGDHRRFEMGETEVRAARLAAMPRSKVRYVIAYVADPQDPRLTRLEILPNPLSGAAEGVVSLLGEGMRFGFRR